MRECFWHGQEEPDAEVREPLGLPVCWDGWVALLHVTGTCAGECGSPSHLTAGKAAGA